MKNGLFDGISNAEYHGGAGISKSGLDLIAQSPLHYWAAYLDPKRQPREETAAMAIGTAIHSAVLEPEKFDAEYIVVPDDAPKRPSVTQRNAKKPSDETLYSIDWWENFALQADGKRILSPDDRAACVAIAAQVRAHPAARVLFADGIAEQSAYWVDKETGLQCKARPDWMMAGGIVDVKSTENASPSAFQRSVVSWRYHVQAAWYLDGIKAATGDDSKAFMFAVFEKKAPYACAFYYADADMLELGRREYRRNLQTYAECLNRNVWPGYSSEILPISLPVWVLNAANDNESK